MAYVFVLSIRIFAICCRLVLLSVYGRLNCLMSCCQFSANNLLIENGKFTLLRASCTL